jgi:hypothetical protein
VVWVAKPRFTLPGEVNLRSTARATEPPPLFDDAGKPRRWGITVDVSCTSLRDERQLDPCPQPASPSVVAPVPRWRAETSYRAAKKCFSCRVPILMPQIRGHPNARLRQEHPQQSGGDRSARMPRRCPRLCVGPAACPADPFYLQRFQHRGRRSAPPDHHVPMALAASDVFVPSAAAVDDAILVSPRVHAVGYVAVIRGDQRGQPRDDRRLGKRVPPMLDRRDPRPATAAFWPLTMPMILTER